MLPRSVLCVQIDVLLLRVTSMYLALCSQACHSCAVYCTCLSTTARSHTVQPVTSIQTLPAPIRLQ